MSGKKSKKKINTPKSNTAKSPQQSFQRSGSSTLDAIRRTSGYSYSYGTGRNSAQDSTVGYSKNTVRYSYQGNTGKYSYQNSTSRYSAKGSTGRYSSQSKNSYSEKSKPSKAEKKRNKKAGINKPASPSKNSGSIYSGYSGMKNFGSYTPPKTNVRIRDGKRIVNTNKGKAKRNRMAFPIFITLFVLCFIYIVGCTYNFLSKKLVSYDVLAYGTIDTPKSAQGIIIRNEKVYNTNVAGVITYDVADNERVKKDTVVCSIKDEATVARMEAALDDINEDIMQMQTEREDISIYSEDVMKSNNEIKNIIDNSAMDYASMNIGKIYELKSNIQKQLDTRNQLLLSESKGALGSLVSQKNEQEELLNSNISRITVDESGIVSYYIDGMEDKLNTDTMLSLSKSDTTASVSPENSFKTSVKSGAPAFRLVTSNVWYIAAYMDSSYVSEWEKGDTNHTVYAKDLSGRKHNLDCTVEEISGDAKAKEKYVVLRITKDMPDFINMRNITFDIENTDRGFKIPNAAIAEETLLRIPTDYIDDTGNVYKVSGETVTAVQVSVSGKNEETKESYIPVQLGVINVGDNIKKPGGEETFAIADVLNTKGIYVVNTGIAEFKTIDMTNSISNNTHTILDPSRNTNIYVYDRILTDIKDVQKEDMVYE